MRRLGLAAAVTIAAVAVVFGGCGDSSSAVGSGCPPRFDSRAWHSALKPTASAPKISPERRALAKQLVRCGYLRGAKRRDVWGMLGHPGRLHTLRQGEHSRRWDYYLGDTPDTATGQATPSCSKSCSTGTRACAA